ncbi:hypothetical protein FSP39_018492 [Pinctada imbricata]|uniref:C2H2-type domain-containing protein n=1 Tax=Pinctada imbricata TaxID=66713 RepID=A0AA88YDW0_PINIB|nr:hypothetical protein FSP39_018492 [Pinctada imbricata]
MERNPDFHVQQCPKTFTLASSLRSHVKIHSEHALKCDVCDKLFFCKSSLSRHKMSHTKEKSNKCHLCDKSFKFLTSYRKHLVRTHKIEPRTARSYKCPHCQNLFSMKDSFLTHLKFYHGFVENNVSEICAESMGDSKNESSEAGVGSPVTRSSNESEEIISKKEKSACALGDDVVKEDALRFAGNEHALFKSLKREPDLETDEGDSEYDLQLGNKDSRGYFRVKNIKVEKEDDFAPMYKIQDINDSLTITQDTASVHDGKDDDQNSETTILDNDSPRWTQDILDNDSQRRIRNISENDSPRRTQHIFNNDSPRQTHDNQTTILHVDHDSPGRTPEDIPIIVYEETDTDIDDSDVTEP